MFVFFKLPWFKRQNITVCYYNVTYPFESESTLYSCLNVKELLARNRRDMWSLSDSNGIRTHYHLVCKQTFSHLAKLARIPLLSLRQDIMPSNFSLISYIKQVSSGHFTGMQPHLSNFNYVLETLDWAGEHCVGKKERCCGLMF